MSLTPAVSPAINVSLCKDVTMGVSLAYIIFTFAGGGGGGDFCFGKK